MKKYLFLCLALVMAALYSCKKDGGAVSMDAAIRHIPSDATQVTVIRLPQLMEKVDFESLKKTDFYRKAIREVADGDPGAVGVLENPEESGINLNQNAYMITDMNPDNPADISNGVLFNLADREKFEDLVNKNAPELKIRKGDGYAYGTNRDAYIAWNKDIVFAGSTRGANIESLLTRVFNIAEDGSILNGEVFERTIHSNDDISYVFNIGAFAKSPSVGMGAGMMGWGADELKDNAIGGSMNFEERKMVAKSYYDLNPTIATDLGMFFKNKVETDFSAYLPGENLAGAFTFALDTRGLLQFLKEKNLLGFATSGMGLNQMGITPESIAEALTGDMAMAVQTEGTDNRPAGIFIMSIDENAFGPFLKLMTDAGVVKSVGGKTYDIMDKSMAADFDKQLGGDGAGLNPQMVINDGKLFVSADPALIAGAVNGGFKGKRMEESYYKTISGGLFSGSAMPAMLKYIDPMDMEDTFDAEDFESVYFQTNKKEGLMEITTNKPGNFLKNMIPQE